MSLLITMALRTFLVDTLHSSDNDHCACRFLAPDNSALSAVSGNRNAMQSVAPDGLMNHIQYHFKDKSCGFSGSPDNGA